jgi:hypothetical protein
VLTFGHATTLTVYGVFAARSLIVQVSVPGNDGPIRSQDLSPALAR